MAKKSSIEKNKRRMKLVKQNAARRLRLKEEASDQSLTMEERFAARIKLASLPEFGSLAGPQPLRGHGARAGLLPQAQDVAHRAARARLEGLDSRSCEIELVGERIMAMNDPLGDMLTRIRNAQMRRKGKVRTPGSRLRGHVLDVLQAEGYIRGYSTTEYGNGRTEF